MANLEESKLTDYKALVFDVYGTLAVRPFLCRKLNALYNCVKSLGLGVWDLQWAQTAP